MGLWSIFDTENPFKGELLFHVPFTNICFYQRYLCNHSFCLKPRYETNGMVVSFLPQLLDCVPIRKRWRPSLSCVLVRNQSSEPFRAFLGAILSVVKDVPVERSVYSSDMELDIIEDDESLLREDENSESDLIVSCDIFVPEDHEHDCNQPIQPIGTRLLTPHPPPTPSRSNNLHYSTSKEMFTRRSRTSETKSTNLSLNQKQSLFLMTHLRSVFVSRRSLSMKRRMLQSYALLWPFWEVRRLSLARIICAFFFGMEI